MPKPCWAFAWSFSSNKCPLSRIHFFCFSNSCGSTQKNRCDYVRFEWLALGVGAFYRIRGEMESCFVLITAHFYFPLGIRQALIHSSFPRSPAHTRTSPYNDANQSFVLFWFILRLEISSLSPTFSLYDCRVCIVFRISSIKTFSRYTRSHSYYLCSPFTPVRRHLCSCLQKCSHDSCLLIIWVLHLLVLLLCRACFVYVCLCATEQRSAETPANRGRNGMNTEFCIHTFDVAIPNVFSDLAVWLCASHASPFIAFCRSPLRRYLMQCESRHLSLSMWHFRWLHQFWVCFMTLYIFGWHTIPDTHVSNIH